MIDGFTPWEVHHALIMPTPWALRDCGVPVQAVQVPFAAAATLEDLTVTCQLVAAMRVRAYADAVHRAALEGE